MLLDDSFGQNYLTILADLQALGVNRIDNIAVSRFISSVVTCSYLHYIDLGAIYFAEAAVKNIAFLGFANVYRKVGRCEKLHHFGPRTSLNLSNLQRLIIAQSVGCTVRTLLKPTVYPVPGTSHL